MKHIFRVTNFIYFVYLFQIESVAISKTEPLWTVNFKRALAAQLQMQLDGASGVFHKEELNSYYAENTVYYTMEVKFTVIVMFYCQVELINFV